MTTWTKCSFRCLKFNAPGTFFVSWFLATPNISQVVYLAIAADSWGFNPQNIESKKQTELWRFCRSSRGFYAAATEALNDDQCRSGSEASIISETGFCQPSYFVQSFCQFNDKTLRRVPSVSSGVGIELIPRIIVVITRFGGNPSTAICELQTLQLL